MLRKMIQVKFGAIPTWADDLIRSADSNQINLWVDSLMTADSLESLLGHHLCRKDDEIFLKTIIPSRKFTKLYLGGES